MDPEKNPYFDKTQCPKCYGYSAVSIKVYKNHIRHIKKIMTPEEMKKFQQFYDFAVEHGYVRNPSSREAKFQRLLQDLTNSDSSLGAEP